MHLFTLFMTIDTHGLNIQGKVLDILGLFPSEGLIVWGLNEEGFSCLGFCTFIVLFSTFLNICLGSCFYPPCVHQCLWLPYKSQNCCSPISISFFQSVCLFLSKLLKSVTLMLNLILTFLMTQMFGWESINQKIPLSNLAQVKKNNGF